VRKVLFLTITLMVLLTQVSLADLPQVMQMNAWGCKSKEMTKKLMGFLASGDELAWKRGLARGIIAGVCTLFKKGERVYATGFSPFSDLVKVRKKGDDVYYWVWSKAVTGK